MLYGENLAQLIKPNDVKVVTKNGECQISIVLELNINLNGDLAVSAQSAQVEKVSKVSKQNNDIPWEIPDFEAAPKIQFGKKQ